MSSVPIQPQRFSIFIDFWNFQLSASTAAGQNFQIDWKNLTKFVQTELETLFGPAIPFNPVGTYVYTSYDASSQKDQGYKKWVNQFLKLQSGYTVCLLERKKKGNPKCASCYQQIATCPSCKVTMSNTEEKGIDTRLSVEMLDLAAKDAYDISVIFSHDSDMVPAVELVKSRGKRVVHFGFKPSGYELRTACANHVDMKQLLSKLQRNSTPAPVTPPTSPI